MAGNRPGAEAEQLRQLIVYQSFISAAGLEGNQKVEMERLPRKSPLYWRFVDRLGDWAVGQQVEVITAVPSGANRFAIDVSHKLNLPLALFRKRWETFVPWMQDRGGLDLINEGAKAGIIEDVRSTGSSTLRLSYLIPGLKAACAIIDRGQDIEGIHTISAANAYARVAPTDPPAHIDVPFPYTALETMPLGLRYEPERE